MIAAFDHREAGTPEEFWAGRGLDRLPTVEPPLADACVLVVAAHPDDETLGAGGLMSDAAARGATVRVLVATDGEASHPLSPTHSPVQLATVRRAEVAEAVAVIAPGAKVEFLGLPDGALAAHRGALAAAVRSRLDGCTLVLSPWTGDRHADHEACAIAVTDAMAGRADVPHWQYPIWAWHWAGADSTDVDLPWSQLHRLELTETAARAKRLALQCHVSQHSPLSAAGGDEAILAPAMLAHFTRDYETFVVAPRTAPAVEAGYFDALYATTDDPWGLAERFYERRKRSLLLASLPRPRFTRAFEPGCATGLLTAELIERCDSVVAWDGAPAAVHQTRGRVGGRAVIEQRRIPDDWPDGAFDLIVLSEVAYYCADLDRLARRARDALTSDGVLVACHWRHRAPDHPHTADVVHERLGAGLHSVAAHRERDFLLDVWTVGDPSVARAEGIVP